MSFKNLLDLRKKAQPQIKIVERVIFQKRPWQKDVFLTLSVIFVTSLVIWGITKADTVIQSFSKPQTKNFSVSGIVINIDPTNIYIEQARGSDDEGRTSYTLDISNIKKVETSDYQPITLSDIKVGNKVVAQGQEDGGNITIKRIIYFGTVVPKEETATTTPEVATTSENCHPVLDTGSSTTSQVCESATGIQEQVSSSTPEQTSATTSDTESGSSVVPENDNTGASTSISTPDTSTSTSTIIDTVTDIITNTIDTVKDKVTGTIQTVIDTVTQNSGDDTNTQTPTSESTSTESPAPAEDPAPTS